ncbi:hemolysin XhlA family protein [Paenibacillus filicis]|uniref:Hemolysin XhlA family protein n=1 Tax=Paenibacillus filicis TaxID=669464 RepID=A0ABU9DIF9_9BACL
MPTDETKQLSEQLVALRLDLVRMETKIDGIKDLTKKVEEIDDRAKESLQSTRSAHKRLDRVEKVVNWAATTIIGSVILAAMAMLLKGKG